MVKRVAAAETASRAAGRVLPSPGLDSAPVLDRMCSQFVLTLTVKHAGRAVIVTGRGEAGARPGRRGGASSRGPLNASTGGPLVTKESVGPWTRELAIDKAVFGRHCAAKSK